MQLVSRGTTATLWNLCQDVPRGTSPWPLAIDICVPRETTLTLSGFAKVFHVERQGGRPHFQIGMFVTVRGMKRSCTLFTGVIISSNCVIGLRDKMIREGQYGKL